MNALLRGVACVGVLLCLLLVACASPPAKSASGDAAVSASNSEALSLTGCTSQTYSSHDYLFCSTLKSWDSARSDCQSSGMDLARINDAAENDFVRGGVTLGAAWIGANDKATEGKWVWSADNTQFWQGLWNGNAVGGLFSKWGVLQPDDLLVQDCGKLSQFDGTWWDEGCGSLPGYVCESTTAPPPPPPAGPADTACWDAAGLQASAPWPMRGLCPFRRSGSKFIGSKTNTVSISYATGGSVRSTPAIGADGTIFAGSDDTYVYALNAAGTLKWRYKTGGNVRSSPALGANGILFVGSADGYLYALDIATGALRWRTSTGASVDSSPAIGADGTVFVGSDSDRLYSLDPGTGSVRWSYKTNGDIDSSPAILSDGTLVVGSDDHFVYALKPDIGLTDAQRLRWKTDLGSDVNAIPAVGPSPDYPLYVRSQAGKMFKLSSTDGHVIASYTGPSDLDTDSSAAVGLDGSVYVGIQHKVFAFKPDLTVKWSYALANDVKSSPSVGSDGTVFIGADDQRLYAFKPADGTVLWSYKSSNLLGFFRSSPVIGKNGTV